MPAWPEPETWDIPRVRGPSPSPKVQLPFSAEMPGVAILHRPACDLTKDSQRWRVCQLGGETWCAPCPQHDETSLVRACDEKVPELKARPGVAFLWVLFQISSADPEA